MMKLMKKFSAVLLSAALLCMLSVTALAATGSNTGNNVENAEDIQILGLGGMYQVANNTVSFNAIIPPGFTAVRLISDGNSKDFTLTDSGSGSNNYLISFGTNDVKTIGECLIRIEADYDGGVVKYAEKTMNTYAAVPSGDTKQINKLNFEGLAESFDDMSDGDKATALGVNSVASKSAVITNGEVSGSMRGKVGDKSLIFTGVSSNDIPFINLAVASTYQSAYTSILNFRFYASDSYALAVLTNGVGTEGSYANFSGASKGEWHDAAIVYVPQNGTATAYLDGKLHSASLPISNNKLTGVRIRTTALKDNAFVAIDDVSLIAYKGLIPDVASLAYFKDSFDGRQSTNGVVPYGTKGFVMDATRGTGGNEGGHSYYKLYKDGAEITTKAKCTYKKANNTNNNTTFHFVFEKEDGTAFETGKYTAVLTASTVLGGTAIQGQIRRDFYVTNENGIFVKEGDCSFDGNTFRYNLSYARSSDQEMTVIAAIYNGKALSNVKLINTNADEHEISGSLTAAGTSAKLMVWGPMTGLCPLAAEPFVYLTE